MDQLVDVVSTVGGASIYLPWGIIKVAGSFLVMVIAIMLAFSIGMKMFEESAMVERHPYIEGPPIQLPQLLAPASMGELEDRV